jgi:hypothetical protein
MLQNRIALDAREEAGRKRQLLRVGRYIDARYCEQIEIYITFDHAPGASDVQIPLPQRKVQRLPWIRHKRSGRLQQTDQAIAPTSGETSPVERLQ